MIRSEAPALQGPNAMKNSAARAERRAALLFPSKPAPSSSPACPYHNHGQNPRIGGTLCLSLVFLKRNALVTHNLWGVQNLGSKQQKLLLSLGLYSNGLRCSISLYAVQLQPWAVCSCMEWWTNWAGVHQSCSCSKKGSKHVRETRLLSTLNSVACACSDIQALLSP